MVHKNSYFLSNLLEIYWISARVICITHYTYAVLATRSKKVIENDRIIHKITERTNNVSMEKY